MLINVAINLRRANQIIYFTLIPAASGHKDFYQSTAGDIMYIYFILIYELPPDDSVHSPALSVVLCVHYQ